MIQLGNENLHANFKIVKRLRFAGVAPTMCGGKERKEG